MSRIYIDPSMTYYKISFRGVSHLDSQAHDICEALRLLGMYGVNKRVFHCATRGWSLNRAAFLQPVDAWQAFLQLDPFGAVLTPKQYPAAWLEQHARVPA